MDREQMKRIVGSLTQDETAELFSMLIDEMSEDRLLEVLRAKLTLTQCDELTASWS